MLTARLSSAKDILENLVQLMQAENELNFGVEKADESIMMVDEEGELNTIDTDEIKVRSAAGLAMKMQEASLVLKQLFFLGLDSDEPINRGSCTAAEVLQFIFETKLALQENDKDMVVLVHEIEYEVNGIINHVKSSLVAKGENSVHTAMAKTVGLPLGIAAKLILDGSLTETGLHIPVLESIYTPVLKELEKYEIVFKEEIE